MTRQPPGEATVAGPPPSRAARRVAFLGIGPLPGLLFCGLGTVLAVLALVSAPRARREIDESAGALGGSELVRIAQVCAPVCLAIAVVVVVPGLAAVGLLLLR